MCAHMVPESGLARQPWTRKCYPLPQHISDDDDWAPTDPPWMKTLVLDAVINGAVC